MAEENLPQKTEDRIYFVENVEGDDFTFYLSVKGNEHLLLEEASGRDEQGQPPKARFSHSRILDVIRMPLLRESDVKDTEDFRKCLEQAFDQEQSLGEKPISGLLGELRARIADPSQGQFQELLPEIIKKLNEWLWSNDETARPDDRGQDFSLKAQETLQRMSERGQRACRKREKLDDYFHEAIEPFQLEQSIIRGRTLICRSYQGKFLCASFRKKPSKSSYKPDSSGDFPLNLDKYCEVLYKAINVTGHVADMRGLLVITGATNSAKSEIATGLIYRYLEDAKETGRAKRPHLVTFEDPIEKYYETAGDDRGDDDGKDFGCAIEMPAAKSGIDFTPREKGNAGEPGKDVESLEQALEDALRQTPAVFFVGETRNKRDWRQLIDFAGTGHLIVTTAHAGLLTEAMRKIFEALAVKTPAERSEIAERLLAIVHIKRHDDSHILVPSVWRRTAKGKNALTAEGLASLLPYRPHTDSEKEDYLKKEGCLGRAWFANELKGMINQSKCDAESQKKLCSAALRWDLEGV